MCGKCHSLALFCSIDDVYEPAEKEQYNIQQAPYKSVYKCIVMEIHFKGTELGNAYALCDPIIKCGGSGGVKAAKGLTY